MYVVKLTARDDQLDVFNHCHHTAGTTLARAAW